MHNTTQADLILSILKNKPSVTANQLMCLDIKSPSAVISRLIQKGYLIDTTIITKKRAGAGSSSSEIIYTLREKFKKPLFGQRH